MDTSEVPKLCVVEAKEVFRKMVDTIPIKLGEERNPEV